MRFRAAGSFALAFVSSLVLTVNAFSEESHALRLAAVLLVLIFVHALMQARLWVTREFLLYLAFAAYNALSILWTSDNVEAGPNLQLTLNFVLILLLFGGLVAYHDRRAVLTGILAGSLAGAVLYTRTVGFPLVRPEGFSYNTIAGMYLFGLFMTAAYGWYRHARILPILIGLVLLLLIAATTSIKTGLGVLLGAAAVALMYFGHSLRAVVRNALPVAILIGVMAYAISSNAALMERLQLGYERISLGANVLLAREDANGSVGLGTRETWKNAGIKGWMTNPVFGNGVEAFRADYGVTSHSTPVDLLYNTGLIGCLLFYASLGSIAWRLFQRQVPARRPLALILGALTCYLFISLSGTMYYDNFLAAVMAISTGLLLRPEVDAQRRQAPECVASFS